MRRGTNLIAVSLACALMSACTQTYKPALKRFDPVGVNSQRAVFGDLTIYIEEYASSGKSEQAFDTKLSDAKVLPLLVLIENKGSSPYELKLADVVLAAQSPLRRLTPAEAARRAERNTLVEAMGWSLIVPIISIPAAATVSALHTSGVNKQIDADFVLKALSDGVIPSGKAASGFLFYDLGEVKGTLSGLSFAMTARNIANNERVAVSIPLPDINYGPPQPSDRTELRRTDKVGLE